MENSFYSINFHILSSRMNNQKDEKNKYSLLFAVFIQATLIPT